MADIVGNNNNKETVELRLYSKSPHISMIVTGFLMLKAQGLIRLEIIPDYKNVRKYPHPHIVETVVNNKITVYDCSDFCDWTASYWEKEKWQDISSIELLMDGIDFYFKRSYLGTRNSCLSEANREKIFPLGFNFHVSIADNPIDHYYSYFSYGHIKYIVKKCFFPFKLGQYWTIDKFEAPANYVDAENLKIIFLARLWDPFGEEVRDGKKRIEREYINSTRIEIIKKLKQLYPDNFIGGIERSDFAEKNCKELVVSKEMTNRPNYIETMKRCDICIGTMGLHESIGWKTSEYIAAARAIVNEKFHYEVPYSFEPYKNYLPFVSIEECVSAVSMLMENPEKVYLQKTENERYYKTFLRPDRQIIHSINIVKNNGGKKNST
jgi:hypothetical protein